jgi:hypothetical protein
LLTSFPQPKNGKNDPISEFFYEFSVQKPEENPNSYKKDDNSLLDKELQDIHPGFHLK